MSTSIARVSGIIPSTLDEVWRLATAVVKSGLAPEGIKETEQVTVAILHGLEIGLPPMQAIQRIAVVNGRPTIWGDAIPALVLSRGFRINEWIDGENDARVAWCEVTRPDGQVITRKFSVADAKRAKLWQTQEKVKRKTRQGEWYEKENDSPWYRYPERMLQMRARGLACRDGAADVLSGMYLREEIDDDQPTPPRDITPRTAPLDLPDIPDEAPAADQAAILREIEKALAGKPPLEVEREYATSIMQMDEDGRAAAVEMIQAAKEQMAAE